MQANTAKGNPADLPRAIPVPGTCHEDPHSTEFFPTSASQISKQSREILAFTLLALEFFPFSPQAAASLFLQEHAIAAEAPEVTLEADVSPRIVLSIFGQLTKHHLFGNSG
jgi:hypothetical protein